MRTKDSLMVVTESNDNACTSHLVRDKSGVWDTLISIYCADGSEIEPLESMESTDKQTQIEVFAIYNAAADGSQYVLYNHKNHKAYITFATFADLTPTVVDLNEAQQYVLLSNKNSTKTPTKNTLNTGNKEEYIANASKFRLIKARLKPIKTK
ncbi:hypothetical protein [Prevotella pallens]|jgi:hypothetical protein|uniref:hypothetical protein n=1 Tax=Prevotella pallens TaxID=60133 RepID=UPI00248FE79D|nr:hypothetical protein [Prevotella pallens]